jgi:hypothetical protein
MRLDDLLDRAIDALTGNDRDQQARHPDVRPSSEDPYGDPADQGHQNMGQYPGGVLPASQDPYGDPADQGYNQARHGDVLPSSQDPYGDPADTHNGQPVLDASQDPYGDPADQEEEPVRPRRAWPF